MTWSVTLDEPPIETTTYSMSSEPPADSERRADERHMTLFRVATLTLGDRRELCLVKNISAGGVSIRAYCHLDENEPIQIEIKQGQQIAGKVTWIRGGDAGITFDERVDIIDLLKSGEHDPRPRMPRIAVTSTCYVREEAVVHRSTLHNISQGGLSVETPNPVTVGGNVTVSIPGLSPQNATVRWNSGNRYGISFNTVLPLAALISWLQDRSAAA